jgi:hypothetical protein
MKNSFQLALCMMAGLLVGCGGSDPVTPPAAPPAATSMEYSDPTFSASEWKFVKDASSTPTHVVLNLVGPTDGSKYRGVGFTLQADPTLVRFGRFKDDKGKVLGYYLDGGVFQDLWADFSYRDPDHPMPQPVTIQAGGVKDDRLMVGIYQKGDDEILPMATGAVGPTAKDCSHTVLQIALDFDASLAAPKGKVPLGILKARALPEHLGQNGPAGQIQDIQVDLGTLTLK